MKNMDLWDKVKQPPKEALKKITGGRLSGMTDIKPQWRVQIMTEVYGLCGIGWKFEVTNKWTHEGSDNQVFAFADIDLYIKQDGEWSDAIPGNGGNMLVTKEKAGLHSSDEAFKMAVTDALSSAMKMIGVASDIYMGNWTGSKYKGEPIQQQSGIGKANLKWLSDFCIKHEIPKTTEKDRKALTDHYKFSLTKTTPTQFEAIKAKMMKDHEA